MIDNSESRPHKLLSSNPRFWANSMTSSTSGSTSSYISSSTSSSSSTSTSSHTSSSTTSSTSSSDEDERTHKTKRTYTRDFWTLDLKQWLDELIFVAECHLLLDRTLCKDDIRRQRSRDKLVVGTVVKCKHRPTYLGYSRTITGEITARGPSNTYTVTFKQPTRSKDQERAHRDETARLRRHFENKLRAAQDSITNSDTKKIVSGASDESSADVRRDEGFRVKACHMISRGKRYVRALELSMGSTSLQAICHQHYVRRCIVTILCLGRQVVGGVVQNICFMSGVRRRIAQYACPSRMDNIKLVMSLPEEEPKLKSTTGEELEANKRSERHHVLPLQTLNNELSMDFFALGLGSGINPCEECKTSPVVHIRLQLRNQRNPVTRIEDLSDVPLPECKQFNFRRIVKHMKRRFVCQGAAILDREGRCTILLGFDQRTRAMDFLVGYNVVEREQIYDIMGS